MTDRQSPFVYQPPAHWNLVHSNVDQTSKWLQRLTFERSVWSDAADQCRIQFRQSKAISELSNEEIEEIALRPYRFQQNLTRVQPVIKAVKTLSRPEEPQTYSRHQELLPGGRWLLSADNLGMVKLFDLEDPLLPDVLSLVAEVTLPGETQELRIHTASDNKVTALVASIQRMENAPHM